MKAVLTFMCWAVIGWISPSTGLLTEFSCNFNDGNLCSLNQQVDDVFNWTVQQGRTSRFSGPERDHGDGTEGFYVYIKASHPQRLVNDNARLASALCEPGNWSLEFYFYAVGRHIGSLSVYTKAENTDYHKLVWFYSAKTNETFYDWTKAETGISETSPFQFVFDGAKKDGTIGDLGLDDITASKTGSAPSQPERRPHGLPITCDFEDGSWCTLISAHYQSQKDWTIHKGPTNTEGTGPSVDRTKGTADGYYIYSDASFTFNGWQTVMSTQIFWPTCGCFMVNFWYHVYGTSLGKLMLIQEGYDTPLWQTNLISRDEWINVQQNYTTTHPTSLLFVGVRGGSIENNYALDDISVQDCGCSSAQGTTKLSTPAPTTPQPSTTTTSLNTIPTTASPETIPTATSPNTIPTTTSPKIIQPPQTNSTSTASSPSAFFKSSSISSNSLKPLSKPTDASNCSTTFFIFIYVYLITVLFLQLLV